MRFLIAFIFLAHPNSFEAHVNLTNLQWRLALLALLLIIADPSAEKIRRIFDCLIVSFSAVSGVFSVMLFPIAFLHYYFKREKQSLRFGLILLCGAIVQLFALFVVNQSPRPKGMGLGDTAALFSKIVGAQIFVASLIGQNGYSRIAFTNIWESGIAIMVTIIGLGFVLVVFLKSKLEIRLLILFSTMLVGGALLSPMGTLERPQWEVFWHPGAGSRYWFIPVVCLFIICVNLAFFQQNRFLKFSAIAALLILPLGIYADWKYPRWKDLEFQNSVRALEAAPSGQVVEILTQPEGWKMKLTKKYIYI